MQKEAKARIKINKLLEEAGWRFFDNDKGRVNVILENNVKITDELLNDFGENYEKVTQGYIDYLLLDDKSFPICILEAKSEDKDPLSGKEQARRYADSLKVRFIILSNGNIHYFWDKETGNPTRISYFPRIETLLHQHTFKPDPNKLADASVKKDYITTTKYPYYNSEPMYVNEATREIYVSEHNLNFLREYQIEAIQSLQSSASKGNNRFLFEMATGTGKTLVSAALIKLFLKTGNAERILFLVDRLELEEQARKNFVNYLTPDYTTKIFKENRDDWRNAQIVVTTIPVSYTHLTLPTILRV